MSPRRALLALLAATSAAAADVWQPGPTSPLGPPSAPMVLDSRRGVVVQFAQHSAATGYTNDVWEYDGTSWTKRPPVSPSPSPRSGHAMAFDSVRGVTVITQGLAGTSYSRETWLYDGTGFTQAADIGYLAAGAAMCFDSTRGRAVIVGGMFGGPFVYYSLVYEWDGGVWTRTLDLPGAARARPGIAFDVGRSVIVIYGGFAHAAAFDDTWEFDGTTWRAGPASPAALGIRQAPAMTYALGRTILFGGAYYDDATWTYDGSQWSSMPSSPELSARFFASMCPLPSGAGALLQGGLTAWGFGATETWHYGPCATIATGTLPAGAVGAPYAQTLTASGGTPPYAFRLLDGLLPPGLALSASGAVTGTPTRDGAWGFRVAATDASGCAAAGRASIRIGGPVDLVFGEGNGSGSGNTVRVLTTSGAHVLDVVAYGAGQWGVNVASGNVDGGATDEIVTGPGPGAVYGPHVRGFDRAGTPMPGISYYAYGTLKYGTNPAAGRIDGDDFAEILTGPGPGTVFGPHVRGWNHDGVAISPIAAVSFFAFGTLRYGVNVAAGDTDIDGFAEILAGAGPGLVFAPEIRAFDHDGNGLVRVPGFSAEVDPTFDAYGANVGAGDIDGDGRDEVLGGMGSGPQSSAVTSAAFFKHASGVAMQTWGIAPMVFPTAWGVRVGAGDLDDDGADEILLAQGPDPAGPATAQAFRFMGFGTPPAAVATFPVFPGRTYGVNVAQGYLAYP